MGVLASTEFKKLPQSNCLEKKFRGERTIPEDTMRVPAET